MSTKCTFSAQRANCQQDSATPLLQNTRIRKKTEKGTNHSLTMNRLVCMKRTHARAFEERTENHRHARKTINSDTQKDGVLSSKHRAQNTKWKCRLRMTSWKLANFRSRTRFVCVLTMFGAKNEPINFSSTTCTLPLTHVDSITCVLMHNSSVCLSANTRTKIIVTMAMSKNHDCQALQNAESVHLMFEVASA